VPVNTLSYVGTKPEQSNDVSGLINLARNIGGSVGTSLFTTTLARHQQVHQTYLARSANRSNPAYVARLDALTQQAMGKAGSAFDARHTALLEFYHQLQHQANVLSYIDVLMLLAVLSACAAPLAFLLKPPVKGAAEAAA
jgi:DHA2 family multidrug resistance protein